VSAALGEAGGAAAGTVTSMQDEGIRPASVAIALTFAAAMASTTVSTPLYPAYQEQFGISSLDVTLVFAAYGAAVMGTLFVFGRLSDNRGRKLPLAGGLVAALAGMVVFLLANDLAALLAGRVLIGITAGLYTGTGTAWLVDLDADRDRATRLAIAANLGGLAVGPILAGLLAEFVPRPLRTVYAVELVLLAAGLVVHLRLPETVPGRRFDLDFGGLALPPGVRKVFVPAATAGIAAFGVSGIFGAVGPAMLGEVFDVTSPTAAGFLVGVMFLTSVAGQFATRRVAPERALPAACGGLAVAVALLALALAAKTLPALVLASIVAGVSQGAIVGAGLGLLAELTPPARRGQVASSYFLALYAGLVVPVVGYGLVETDLGLTTTGLVFCGVVGAVVFASGLGVRRTGVRAT
jgi:MFS family permease